MDAGIHANHCIPMQIIAQYMTAEYPFNMIELFPTARTTKKTITKTLATTIEVNRKSWRVESIAVIRSSIISLIILLAFMNRWREVGYPRP
jgi:hypothetical protein